MLDEPLDEGAKIPASALTGDALEQSGPCPYLWCFWDSTIRAYGPDTDNRCFVRFRRVRFLWFLSRSILGASVDLQYQVDRCYGDHGQCPDYQKKSSQHDPRRFDPGQC